MAKVTTKAGKELDGVYVPDRETALAVDKFTWKPKGQDGYFVRMKHVVRPQGDALAAYSMASAPVPADKRMSTESIVKVVDEYMGHFAAPVPVRVVDSLADVPGEDGGANAKGVTKEGNVYLIRAGISDRADAVNTLFHELLHFGVRQLLSKNKFTH